MDTITNTEVALLGLLAEREMYPYEMEKEISEHDMQYWTEISLASVYKVLAKLEKKQLVDVKITVSEGNKVKKIYSITPGGLQEFKERIRKICSEIEHSIDQIDLGLANLRHLQKNEVNELFTRYIESIDTLISGYRDLEKYITENECVLGKLHLSRRRQILLAAEKKWAQQFLKEYNDENT
ncbi:MAG: PadR family transcriptional regulator [Methanoregula sp.]|jgi:DNA-binding PadR family transcriptional regulator|nr:PadR family transcriptional regulator [Methanoregula sp.]